MDLEWIAAVTGARKARPLERVQTLWSGYGEIVRVGLEGAPVSTVIVKHVAPSPRPKTDVSHARKLRSYAVERTFYERFAGECRACRVPRFVAAQGPSMILEDLDAAGFPGRKHAPRGAAMDGCLAWLAAFHATFMGRTPEGLWPEGTYWHLATRGDELAAVGDRALRDAAAAIDQKIADCTYRTWVHGDAKAANFCFGEGDAIAAVDFQYVGGGCGMKDVAYLVSGEADEDALLDRYFVHLHRAMGEGARDVERAWRPLYRWACADFYRFLAGWSPGSYERDAHAKRLVRDVLNALR